MSEAKEQNWVPWIAMAGLLAYVIYTRQPSVEPGPQPQPTFTVSQAFDNACADWRKSHVEALKGMAALTTDEEKLKFFNDTVSAGRERAFKPYVEIVAKAAFEWKTVELAERLEAGK